MDNNVAKRISVDAGVMAGKPVIKGTRIPVDTIVRLLGNGRSEKQILADYLQLTPEDIRAALLYSAAVVRSESVIQLA
jgi:uncharacterized protein (DUF433 family)